MNVKTLSTYSEDFFSDSFSDESKISQKENVIVGGGTSEFSNRYRRLFSPLAIYFQLKFLQQV
jgi:hypothetical protein